MISLPKKLGEYEPDSLLRSGKSFGRNRTTLDILNESRSSSAKIPRTDSQTNKQTKKKGPKKMLVGNQGTQRLIIKPLFFLSKEKGAAPQSFA